MNSIKINPNKLMINDDLVHSLVATQFPQWKNLSVFPVTIGGWDNLTFHLDADMLIRMPRAPEYAAQVENGQRWLPLLAPFLSLQIPAPLARGEPTNDYHFINEVLGYF